MALSKKSIENIQKQSDNYIAEATAHRDKIHDMASDYILGEDTTLSRIDEEYKKLKNTLKKLKDLRKFVQS